MQINIDICNEKINRLTENQNYRRIIGVALFFWLIFSILIKLSIPENNLYEIPLILLQGPFILLAIDFIFGSRKKFIPKRFFYGSLIVSISLLIAYFMINLWERGSMLITPWIFFIIVSLISWLIDSRAFSRDK